MLEERIKLVQHEIASRRKKIEQTQMNVDYAETKRAELAAENETLKNTGAMLPDDAAWMPSKRPGRHDTPIFFLTRDLAHFLPRNTYFPHLTWPCGSWIIELMLMAGTAPGSGQGGAVGFFEPVSPPWT